MGNINSTIDFAEFAANSGMHFSKFFLVWPWIGLGFFISIMILAFGTNLFRSDLGKSRWYDPAWLAWLGAAAYMLHNIEEYGIAFNGMRNAFPYFMTGALGFEISEGAYLATNLGLVWVCGPLAALLAKKLPGMAVCMSIFELINGLSHVAQAAIFHMYNPGLVQSIVVFFPLCIWTLYVCFFRKPEVLSGRLFLGQFLVGFVYHAILMMGVNLARLGLIGPVAQTLIMVVDAFIAIGGWYFFANREVARNRTTVEE